MSRVFLAAILASAIATSAQGSISSYYAVTDLGSLGGSSVATAINDDGWIVGYSEIAPGRERAFLWKPGQGMTQLSDLGGDSARAADINERGEIVGGSETDDFNYHATLWRPDGSIMDLSPRPDYFSSATGINNLGHVVMQTTPTGSPFVPTPFSRATERTGMTFWSEADGFADYGTLGGVAAAPWDINDNGQIALTYISASLPAMIARWDPIVGLWLITPDLDDLEDDDRLISVGGFAINNDGEMGGSVMVGSASAPRWHDFVAEITVLDDYDPDTPIYQSYLGERGPGTGSVIVLGLSYNGRPLGAYYPDGSSDPASQRAFIGGTDPNLHLISRDLGWTLQSVQDVARVGREDWWVGYGLNPAGETHAFLLRSVPEPGSAALIGFGFFMLCVRRRRSAPVCVPPAPAAAAPAPRGGRSAPRMHGYTVMEMVVAAAVMTAAMSLMLPAIGGVKQSVNVSGCLTRMHGLTHAGVAYALDHNGRFMPDERLPAYERLADGSVQVDAQVQRDNFSRPPQTWEGKDASWFGQIENTYLGGDRSKVDCPVVNSHRWYGYDDQTGDWVWPVDYAANRFGLNTPLSAADDPGRNVMFGEPNMSRATVHYVVEVVALYLWWSGDSNRTDLEQHSAGALSFGFVDGHATRVDIPQVKNPVLQGFPELALSAGSPPATLAVAASNYFWWNSNQVDDPLGSRRIHFPIPNDLVDRR